MTDVPASDDLTNVGEETPIAGFWRRLAAFLVDCTILALPAFLVGLLFFDWASSLGQFGRVIGFVVYILYFGLLNSWLGNGQTLGKHLLEICVVDRQDRMLSPMRSILRCLPIAVPYFINGLWVNTDPLAMGLAAKIPALLIQWIVFGGLGATLYLFVFNRRTRQSLDDLAVGSFVIRASMPTAKIDLSTPRLHIVIASLWLAATFIVSLVLLFWPTPPSLAQSWQQLSALQAEIENKYGTPMVKVSSGSTRFFLRSGTKTTGYLTIDMQPRTRRSDDEATAHSIAAVALRHYPTLSDHDRLVVLITRGFDFGIASWNFSFREAWSVAEWREKLDHSPSGESPSPQ